MKTFVADSVHNFSGTWVSFISDDEGNTIAQTRLSDCKYSEDEANTIAQLLGNSLNYRNKLHELLKHYENSVSVLNIKTQEEDIVKECYELLK